MKVRLLVDCEGPNPEFNPPDPRVDREAWMVYKHQVPDTITLPAGTEIDDPDAWRLCLPHVRHSGRVDPPRAEPIDDNAKLMVAGEIKGCDKEDRGVYERFWARENARRAKLAAEPAPEAVAKAE